MANLQTMPLHSAEAANRRRAIKRQLIRAGVKPETVRDIFDIGKLRAMRRDVRAYGQVKVSERPLDIPGNPWETVRKILATLRARDAFNHAAPCWDRGPGSVADCYEGNT